MFLCIYTEHDMSVIVCFRVQCALDFVRRILVIKDITILVFSRFRLCIFAHMVKRSVRLITVLSMHMDDFMIKVVFHLLQGGLQGTNDSLACFFKIKFFCQICTRSFCKLFIT